MTQPSQGPLNGADAPTSPVPDAHTGQAGPAEAPGASATGGPASGNPAADGGMSRGPAKYQAVLGPFTPRDLTVFGTTLVMFIASLLPMFGGGYNLWNLGNLFFLALGIVLPVVVVALFVARRLQPANVIRIGSLSIDQFASVVASFAVALFFLTTAGAFTGSAVLGLVGALGLLAATVLGPFLPFMSADFKDRPEAPAHVVAREAAVPTRRPIAPKAPKPAKQHPSKQEKPVGATAGKASRLSAVWASAVSRTQAAGAKGGSARLDITAPGTTDAASATAPSSDAAPSSATAADATRASAVVPPAGQLQETAGAPEQVVTNEASQPDAGPVPPHVATPADILPPTAASPIVPASDSARHSSIGGTVDPSVHRDSGQAPQYEAFWFAVAQPRTAVDEHTGAAVFTIEPGGWVLALEDRGHEFLVQHSDGRVGILRDLSHIERG